MIYFSHHIVTSGLLGWLICRWVNIKIFTQNDVPRVLGVSKSTVLHGNDSRDRADAKYPYTYLAVARDL